MQLGSRSSVFRFLTLFTLAVLGLTALGCASTSRLFEKHEKTFATQDQAASTHIAVLSVERWEDAKDFFQPDFKLTEDEALNRSLATTQAVEQQFLDTLQLALRLQGIETGALPGFGAEDEESDDDGTDSSSTTASGSGTGTADPATEEPDPRDPSGLETLDPAASTPGGSRPSSSVLDTPLATEPMLDYLTATALYQEVQMLNRYVDHAVQKQGYEPYLVRMQVSLLPRARNEPYDAYLWASFFTDNGEAMPYLRKSGISRGLVQDEGDSNAAQAGAEESGKPGGTAHPEIDGAESSVGVACDRLKTRDFDFRNDWSCEPVERLNSAEISMARQSTLEWFVDEHRADLEVVLESAQANTPSENTLKTCQKLARKTLIAPTDTATSVAVLGAPATRERTFIDDLVGLTQDIPEDLPDKLAFQERCREVFLELAQQMQVQQGPIVVPLLVTDNLEATQRSISVDHIRQFALGLGFLLQSVGGNAQFTKFQRDLQTVLGQDLNSLLTVARVSDNTYGVRLGAMQQVKSNYAAVPRTHNLTLLLLVPQPRVRGKACPVDSPSVKVVSHAQLFHARSGKQVRPRAPGVALSKNMRRIKQKYSEDLADPRVLTETCMGELQGLAQRNQQKQFRETVRDKLKPVDELSFPYESLWLDLIETVIGGSEATTSFDLPPCFPPRLPCAQIALLEDDTKTKTTASLVGGFKMDPKKLQARLLVLDEGPDDFSCKEPKAPSLVLPAHSIQVTGGSIAQITFPSLKHWQLSAGRCARLELFCRECEPPKGCPKPEHASRQPDGVATASFPVRVKVKSKKPEEKKEEPLAAFRVAADYVRSDDHGKGTLVLEYISKKALPTTTRLGFQVDGADVVGMTVLEPSADAASVEDEAAPGRHWLKKPAIVKVDLENLTPQGVVLVKGMEIRNAGSTDKKKPEKSLALGTPFKLPVFEGPMKPEG